MLKKNISTNRGLCNGSTGVIQEFHWGINRNVQISDGDLPNRIKILLRYILLSYEYLVAW
jgi:hypothetical protein